MGYYVKKKIEYLIVDTSAFINKAAIQELAENILTVPQVLEEIKSKRQLRRLVTLPYELSVKEAFPENIKFVTEFSKKTGDYASLSITDVNVIALTYQLEKEKNGVNHLRNAPVCRPTIQPTTTIPEDLKKTVGFYVPKKGSCSEPQSDQFDEVSQYDSAEDEQYDSAEDGECDNVTDQNDTASEETQSGKNYENKNNNDLLKVSEKENDLEKINGKESVVEERNGIENVKKEINSEEEFRGDFNKEWSEKEVDDNYDDKDDDDDVDGDDDDDDDDDDDGHWITPSNIEKAKNQIGSKVQEDFEDVKVACLTTDFAMQNVLKQIGLHVISIDGKLIKQLRTFILRCYGCFKTTSVMTKVFCPNCGNKTLKKVAVSLDENGVQRVHINFRRPLTARGKRYSLPLFKGGKHSKNPVICEDQPMPQQRPSRLSRTKNNPLNDDYIAGYSPFVTRDVTSKSAMLGIKPYVEMKHWMKKNPNESRKKKK